MKVIKDSRNFKVNILLPMILVWAGVIFTMIYANAQTTPSTTTTIKKTENDYNKEWCPTIEGTKEVTLHDGTRCDCVNAYFAVEMDWADKWYEAMGQSLHYAIDLNKYPGIVLILKAETDKDKYVKPMLESIKYWRLPINVWTIKAY